MSNVQKFREMLVAFPNSPYICSAHLQIEGVSGLDRLDAASSPAFFRAFQVQNPVGGFSFAFFPTAFPHIFPKDRRPSTNNSPHFVAPFRPVQAEGGFFLPFCQPRDIGTRLAKKESVRRKANASSRAQATERSAATQVRPTRRTLDIIYSNKNKKATYHYGKDYWN